MPSKAALSKFRKNISYLFFKEKFELLIQEFESKRKTFKGMKIYAIDGFQIHLPRTKDIIGEGYTGRAVSKYRESCQPRMYLVHAYDVLSKVTKTFRESCLLNEIRDAKEIVPTLEVNSLTIYDRLYISRKMIEAHKNAGNKFLFRARRNSFKEVQNFCESSKKCSRAVICGVEVMLIKVKTLKQDQDYVFVTNLSKSFCKEEIIKFLYQKRWEVEESFKDLSEKMRLEQWHTKFINGIRQELYAVFWLKNFVRIQMVQGKKAIEFRSDGKYEVFNFRFLYVYVVENLEGWFRRNRRLREGFKALLKKCTEVRKRYSRSYERELKNAASPYPRNNTVWNVS